MGSPSFATVSDRCNGNPLAGASGAPRESSGEAGGVLGGLPGVLEEPRGIPWDP